MYVAKRAATDFGRWVIKAMNRIIIFAVLASVTTAQAYFDSTNSLSTEAGVWWGDESLTGNDVTGTMDVRYASGYTNSAEFVGSAAATANYDAAHISMTFGQSHSFVLDFTQQVIRARAQFADTFVISGPIGTGTVVYSEEESDTTSTSTIHLEDEPTNIVNPEITVTRRIIHNGHETDIRPVVPGARLYPASLATAIPILSDIVATNDSPLFIRLEIE